MWKYTTEDGESGHRLSIEERERGIQRLMNMQLLKRLESSVNSFRLTLTRIKDYMQETLDVINRFKKGERSASVDDYEKADTDEDERGYLLQQSGGDVRDRMAGYPSDLHRKADGGERRTRISRAAEGPGRSV